MPSNRRTTESGVQALEQRFVQLFGESPRIYQAPGRVNLIGEHTDYNDGFVMPAAIGLHTRVAGASRTDRKLVVHSENYSERIEFDLDHLPVVRAGHWSDYVVGVVRALKLSGIRLAGASLLVDGDVPQGVGLSSSASIEVAVCFTLAELACEEINRTRLALICQQAENVFVGAQCGIMDQFVSSHGKRDHALLLDCRSLEYRLLPLPKDVPLVISNTMVKHSIATGEYNQRRAECEAGVRALAKHLPHIRALRDVTLENFAAHGQELPEKVMRRCRHVISENARVIQAADALERKDLSMFGALMQQSHCSLRDDFEVSCSELDLMVELGEQVEGVYGTRMMGGGFGGCTITLIQADSVEEFQYTVSEGYERATGRKPQICVCSAADGVCQVVSPMG
jgi:galactokinase